MKKQGFRECGTHCTNSRMVKFMKITYKSTKFWIKSQSSRKVGFPDSKKEKGCEGKGNCIFAQNSAQYIWYIPVNNHVTKVDVSPEGLAKMYFLMKLVFFF